MSFCITSINVILSLLLFFFFFFYLGSWLESKAFLYERERIFEPVTSTSWGIVSNRLLIEEKNTTTTKPFKLLGSAMDLQHACRGWHHTYPPSLSQPAIPVFHHQKLNDRNWRPRWGLVNNNKLSVFFFFFNQIACRIEGWWIMRMF